MSAQSQYSVIQRREAMANEESRLQTVICSPFNALACLKRARYRENEEMQLAKRNEHIPVDNISDRRGTKEYEEISRRALSLIASVVSFLSVITELA